MPIFTRRHYKAMAELIGTSDLHDELVQAITNCFGNFLAKDNPRFNFTRFQSLITRFREGKYGLY